MRTKFHCNSRIPVANKKLSQGRSVTKLPYAEFKLTHYRRRGWLFDLPIAMGILRALEVVSPKLLEESHPYTLPESLNPPKA